MSQLQTFFAQKNAGNKMDGIPKDLLDDVVALLTPLKEQTDEVQAKKTVTACLPLVSYHKLRKEYKPQEADTDIIRVMRARLYRELERVVELTKTHTIATFLDPSFRGLKNMMPEEDKPKVCEYCV